VPHVWQIHGEVAMSVFRRAIAVLMSLCFFGWAAAGSAQAQSGLPFSIDSDEVDIGQGWRVGFSQSSAGCVATARYRDGTRVWLGVSAKIGRFIAFSNPSWRSIEDGGVYEIHVHPRGGRRWRIDVVGVQMGQDRGIMSGSIKLDVMEDIAHAAGFAVELAGRRIFGGELSGSRRALTTAFSCFDRNKTEAERIAANQSPTPKARTDAPPKLAGNGTGFFVGTDGHILTNEHVTRGCRIRVLLTGTSWRR
jgi:hypothetical protein